MENYKSFIPLLHEVNEGNFEEIALRVFQFQAKNNPVYHDFIRFQHIDTRSVQKVADIPFMPITFFKTQVIKSGDWHPQACFESSGTTQSVSSRHWVADLEFYRQRSLSCFEHFFGPIEQFHFLALLPSYLERSNSSLIAMMDHFIKASQSTDSGFYLYNYEELIIKIDYLRKHSNRKIILWGVSFALLDLAEQFPQDFSDLIIFETGGMKGRRRELTRPELHDVLRTKLGVSKIYSEYGMTELFSQAYTEGESVFNCPPGMRIIIRDIADPFEKGYIDKSGGINVIDLANIHSVSFIETEDAGKCYMNGSFEVLGRLDNSDVRGCNLMVE